MSSYASSSDSNGEPFTIILFYLYTHVAVPKETLAWQEGLCRRLNLKGRIRIATEGINGTLAGRANEIADYIADMNDTSQPHGGIFAGIEYKYSTDPNQPFPTLGMFEVPELTASGSMAKSCKLLLEKGKTKLTKVQPPNEDASAQESSSAAATTPATDATEEPDTHLTPAEFHEALLNFNPDTDLLLDTRNSYETMIGTFEGAIDPKIRTFAQLPEYITQNLPTIRSKKNIYMFCTGGIRCEKASVYMSKRTGAQVRQLKGGIHKYLDEFPDGGLFRGKNFVFDGRLAMASQNKEIIGKCTHCAVTNDDLSEDVLCRVCRSFIILCPECRTMYKDKGWQFYCQEHMLLSAGKDYQPNASVTPITSESTSSSSSSSSLPTPPASNPTHPPTDTDSTGNGDAESFAAGEGPDRPEDSWSPPSDDLGNPQQMESFLSRFTIDQLETQLAEIEKIFHFFRTAQKKAHSRSKNRKRNLHLQKTRLEAYLNKRKQTEAEARGEVWVPPAVQDKKEKYKAAAVSASSSTSSNDGPAPLISFVPLLNV